MITNKDLKFFQRELKCLKCEKEFTTDEISHEFINELEILRKINKELQQKINKIEKDENEVNEIFKKSIISLEKQKGDLINKLNTLESFKKKFFEIQQALKVIKKYG